MRSPTRRWRGIRSSILLANSRFCYLSPLDLIGQLPVSPLNGSLPAVSDLHRQAHCDEYGQLLKPTARGNRSHGNPDTDPDPAWMPLINTPSHPEYPAGHPSLNGAAATIPLSYFRRRQTFTLSTIGLPNRTYTSIAQARSDGNNARVWGGMHYPSTIEISDAVGEAIANYVNLNSMQRLHRGDEDK